MVQRDYPSPDQFLQIDWHTSGPLANGSGSSRASYYGVSGVPDVRFDGIDAVVGAGDSLSAYNQYRTRVLNHYTNQWSQLIIRDAMWDVDLGAMTATVTATIEVAPGETITTPSDVKIRSAMSENNLVECCEPNTNYSHFDHIGRRMASETTLTISSGGQTQQYTGTFALDASWKLEDLHVIVFVQRNTGRYILQSGEACRMYRLEVENLDPPVTSSTAPVDFDVQLTYAGCVDDDVVVTLDKSGLPADWDAAIVVGSNVFPNTTTFPAMASGQVQPYVIRVIPGATAALGAVPVETAPASNSSVGRTETYAVFANTEAILYVNDDNGGASQPLVEDAITSAGHFFFTHDVDTQGDPTLSFMSGFDAIIWNTGQLQYDTIEPATQADLVSYLDGGGKLFLSSHGILNQYGTTPNFMRNYLRVLTVQQDWQAINCTGVPGDPIGDGLSFLVSGSFLDLADLITPNTGGVIWLHGQWGDVGVHYDSGTFQTVFLTAAIELVPEASRNLVMARVLNWFFPGASDVRPAENAEPLRLALGQNAPNPFTGETSVRFTIPKDGKVSLDVFNVAGRRVARLVDRVLPAGHHAATWDGRDAGGSRVASGVYLYRLNVGGESVTKEMVLTR